MPGKIKVKVLAGRNLPVMDRAGDTTDAFVEIKFGGVTHKTDVCRKSLNPHWNSTEWYRFEVDESELQDEPLQLRLMDHDTYSANDAIGKVVISLSPLLAREPAQNVKGAPVASGGAVMSGWIPVFDTMHGIRGELNVIVKVELFSDFNKYKTSSCGVQFFHCPTIPPGYRVTTIHGFVEELVVNDDPEYQWIDKIRTPRASNEARQVAFIKLSNQVQRLVGLKAAELGANAVVGYQQDFDLEAEAGVVARAIGTAVSIVPLPTPSQPLNAAPCSQQQLKKYLDVLATDNESITDLNEYFQSHQDELQKLLHILHPKVSSNFLDETENVDDDEKNMEFSRQSSMKSYAESVSIYHDDHAYQKSFKTISEDQTDLNKLLNRGEDDSDSITPMRKIKKLKTNFFSKRLLSKKSKKSDKQDDSISINSNSSDVSRISLTDIRNEFKKFKRLKKPKFRKNANLEEEGVGMASILARSVMHVETSLACIAETQDSENSPGSTMRRTSESEPNLNISDEEKAKITVLAIPKLNISDSRAKVPEIFCSSLKHINSDEIVLPARIRRISESCPNSPVASRNAELLKLPGEQGYFGSVSSALSESSGMFSSSDEDDESSDVKTDTEKSIETTSSVVQTVLSSDVNLDFIAQMDKKLSILESSSPEPDAKVIKKELSIHNEIKDDNLLHPYTAEVDNSKSVKLEETADKLQSEDSSTDESPSTTEKSKTNLHFKFHNPFTHKESFSAPSSPDKKHSFVYRSSKRIKRQLSKISNSSMIKSLSHISLIPKSKHVQPQISLSQPASASDLQSKALSHETVLGSPLLSYSDLLILDKEAVEMKPHKPSKDPSAKVEMYIGSEPASRASVSAPSSPPHSKEEHESISHKHKDKPAIKPTGLLHTAMETILIDKLQSLLVPTSPEPVHSDVEKKFFEDVNHKLELVEEDCNKRAEIARHDTNNKKLIRQDSISLSSENVNEQPSLETSIQPDSNVPCGKLIPKPVLESFHPLLSGVKHQLETIPSLPDSFDRSQSLDVEGLAKEPSDLPPDKSVLCASSGTNCVSVCDNSHAACRAVVGRSERDRDKEKDKCEKDKGSPRHARHESCGGKELASSSGAAQNSSLNASSTPVGMHRRSSDSDLSVTPKGSSLNASTNAAGSGGGAILRPSMNSNNLDMLDHPFLTMTEYPYGFVVHIGGTVCARSVKLVDSGGESASRAAWWAELRTELRAHMRALRCNAVTAYTESAAICEDVCVLSVSGTAVVINLDCDFNAGHDSIISVDSGSKNTIEELECEACSIAHLPYTPGSGPYRAELSACAGCRRARVPAVLLATCSKPSQLVSYGKAITLTAVAARVRRAPPNSEPGARDISDQMPFLEYELYKLLQAKLRMQGANALFNLHTQISIGERCVMALATGIAYKLASLPPPTPPRIKGSENDKDALEIQKSLLDTFAANKTSNGYDVAIPDPSTNGVLTELDKEDAPILDLCADKDACLLELDETEDVETARSLSVRRVHMQVYERGMAPIPGANPHAFVQVCRGRFPLSGGGAGATSVAERVVCKALDTAQYKLRRLRPAALVATRVTLELPEDEIQLVLTGTAIPLEDPSKQDLNVSHIQEQGSAHGRHVHNSSYGRSSYHGSHGHSQSSHVHGHSSNGQSSHGHGHSSHAQSSHGHGQSSHVHGHSSHGQSSHSHGQSSHSHGQSSHGHGHSSHSHGSGHGDADDAIFALDEEHGSPTRDKIDLVEEKPCNAQSPTSVCVTSLSSVAGARVSRRICALRLLFVRETTAVRELGGLSGFLHTTTCEVLAIVRAYTAALGGNALTSYYITQLMIQDNAHKNQGQCLLSVGGDVVHVTY